MAVTNRDVQMIHGQLAEGYRRLQRQQQEYGRYIKEKEQEFSELQRAMVQSATMTQAGMVERLNQMEAALRESYTAGIGEMRNAYQRELERVQRLEAEYNRKLGELSLEQRRIASEIDRKNTHARLLAKQQEEKMKRLILEAGQQPVEVFYPHRLDYYLQAGERAKKLMEEGLYTLAANDYSNIYMGLSGLLQNTRQKVDELDAMFEIYRVMVAKADLLKTAPWELKDEEGDVILSLEDERDMDYWSDTLFYVLSNSLEEHREIAQAGSKAWVREHSDSQVSLSLLLDQQIRSLETIPDQLELCISYALSACDCYNYLMDIREDVIQAFQEQNYEYAGTFFGERNAANLKTPGYRYYEQWLLEESCVRAGGEPDYREERCMRFYNQAGNSCEVSLVPVRTNHSVACSIRLKSTAEHNPERVGVALQKILMKVLGRPVELAEHTQDLRAAKDRLMTERDLKLMAAVPEKEQLSAKYCAE